MISFDTLTIFAVNRSEGESLLLEVDTQGFEGYRLIENIVLENSDIKAANKDNHNLVKPHNHGNAMAGEGKLTSILSKLSWNVIRLCKSRP